MRLADAWHAAPPPRVRLPSHTPSLQATSGEPGDCENFSEYVKANLKLYELRNGAKLTTHAAGNYIRNELATALRKVGRLRCTPRPCVGVASKAAVPASPQPPTAA